MAASPLCVCNNCNSILIDTNPAPGAPSFNIDDKNYKELELLQDEDGFFRGCPNCETDGYLMDITEENANELLKD